MDLLVSHSKVLFFFAFTLPSMKLIVAFGALLYWLSVSPRIRSLAMLCTGADVVTSIIVEVGDERYPTIERCLCT